MTDENNLLKQVHAIVVTKNNMDNIITTLDMYSDYSRGRTIINVENPYKYFCEQFTKFIYSLTVQVQQ